MESDEIATLLEYNWDTTEKENWHLHSSGPDKNYSAAMAIRSNISSINIYHWSDKPN